MTGRRFRALLIGNGSYDDPDQTLLPLKGPKNDVAVLQAALTDADYGLFATEDVTVHTDLAGVSLAEELFQFVDQASSDDMLLIYFSGHGERVSGQRLGLCGVDLQHSKRETGCFKAAELQGWIVERNRARSTVVVLDCCYSGIFKGGGAVAEEDLAATFGEGTIVMASGGNQVSKDAAEEVEPSPFTAALAAVLCDPALAGDDAGLVTPQAIYDHLLKRAPALVPEPKLRCEVKGRVPLARRPVLAAAPSPLTGWMDQQEFETIEVEIGADSVVARHTAEGDEPRDLGALDQLRRNALQLLAELADGVARSPAFKDNERLRHAVMRTWSCIGSNLLETTMPPGLRARLTALDATGRQVVKLRLRFAPEARELAAHPWELLRLADSGYEDDRPLALQRGLMLERAVSPTARPSVRRSSASASVVVFNTYDGDFGTAGRRIAGQVGETHGLLLVKDLHGAAATFPQFADALDQRPTYLVLCAPVRRSAQHGELGFAKGHSGPEDFRSSRDVVDQMQIKDLAFDAIVLVTFAAPPGEDSYRAIHDVAATLAESGRGPVVFACHSPGYESYLAEDENPTFPGLLLDAMSRESHGLDRCFWYARERAMTHAQPRQQEAFGVPGCYVPSESSAAPPSKVSPGAPGGRGGGIAQGIGR